MTADFYHGVRTRQIPTSIVPPRRIMSALPIILGCAPIHRLPAEEQAKSMPGEIRMIYNLSEAGTYLGIDIQRDDFSKWTLSEMAYSEFMLFLTAPCVFINLFDPNKHKKPVSDEEVILIGKRGQLAHEDIIGDVTLRPIGGGDAFVAGIDYMVNPVTGAVTVMDDGALATVSSVRASYEYAAPELVTAKECIGGYDVLTGRTKGISLIDRAFPKYREVPAVGIAPKYAEDPNVAAILAAKMGAINSAFRGIAIADIPSDGEKAVRLYSDVPEYKQLNNLVSEDLYLCWPKIKFGDHVMHISVQGASLIGQVDADNKGIPYASPSNKNLMMEACVADGVEQYLGVDQANYLNKNGIATPLNWENGWVLWGNRMACYPGNTDPKDAFITHRRMMAWYGNRLTLTYWSQVDKPMNRRFLETIVNSENININSLTANQYIYGGRISLLSSENAITDLIDGHIRFHIYLGLIAPAEDIEFDLELDPYYVETLFGVYGQYAA